MKEFDISVQRFDEFADEYADKFMDIGAYRDSLDALCGLAKGTPRILELACGPGNFTRYLRQQFAQSPILAVDLAPRMLEIAQEQVPDAEFKLLDVRNIRDLGQTFELIMCSFCLPFLSREDARQLLRDCAASLAPNGLLYLSTMEGNDTNAGFEATNFSGNSEVYFNYFEQAFLETWEAMPPYFITSAETGAGRDEILDFIQDTNLNFAKPTI